MNRPRGGLTDAAWQQFERDGFLRLGQVATDDQLLALQTRVKSPKKAKLKATKSSPLVNN